MIEQSQLNGPLYRNEIIDGKLVSEKVKRSDITFGKSTPIIIYHKATTDMHLIKVEQTYYLYEDQTFIKTIVPTKLQDAIALHYLAGVCFYKDRTMNYYIKNKPTESEIDQVFDPTQLTLPASITGYPYDQVFTYSPELIELIGNCPAAYVDRFKRPLNPESIKERKYFPITVKNAGTTFKELESRRFPIAVDLDGEAFSVIDLEPGYTPDDLNWAEEYPYIYVEDTPRGGKHYLIRTKTLSFKYRLTDKLEIISNGLITFYGINSKIRDLNAPYINLSTLETYAINKSEPVDITTLGSDIQDIVEPLIEEMDRSTLHAYCINTIYEEDDDLSRADFKALVYIWHNFVKRYKSSNNMQLLPWILGEIGRAKLPYRIKHDTMRSGAPYLVYLSAKIVQTSDDYDK